MKILGIYQLTEDTSSSGLKNPVFVKSLEDNSEVSITGSNKPKLSEAQNSTLSNHDIGEVPSNESQRNTTDHSVVVSGSLSIDYDSADESSVYSIPLPPLEKLTGAEPVSGPKTIKSILKYQIILKTVPGPDGMYGNKLTHTPLKVLWLWYGFQKRREEKDNRKSTLDAYQLLEGKLVC
ncbi:hypothetical protein Tco_1103260 [Tanacetum coccineum]